MLFDNLELLDLKKAEVLEEVNGRLQAAKLSQNAQPANTRWGLEWLFARDETEQFRSAVLGYKLESENAVVKLLAITPAKISPTQSVPLGGILIQALRNQTLIETYENRRRIAAENLSEGGVSLFSGARSGKTQFRLRAYRNWSLLVLVGYFPLSETTIGGNKIRWPILK